MQFNDKGVQAVIASSFASTTQSKWNVKVDTFVPSQQSQFDVFNPQLKSIEILSLSR